MIKLLRISAAIKNTCTVNGFLYFLRQIPLIGKFLPESLYQKRWVKILAQVVAVLVELFRAFAGKILFLLLLVFLPAMLYEGVSSGRVFLHVFFLLTLAGMVNNGLTDTDRPTYYTVLLMGMDAKGYTLLRFGYRMAKLALAYLLLGIVLGVIAGAPVWLCLLMPVFPVGVKLAYGGWQIAKFQRLGNLSGSTVSQVLRVLGVMLLLGAAYGLPALGITLPYAVVGIGMVLGTMSGIFGLRVLGRFSNYRLLHQALWQDFQDAQTEAANAMKTGTQSQISMDSGIVSKRRGFGYLNELFVKRHKKLFWKQSWIVTGIAAAVAGTLAVLVWLEPESRPELNGMIMDMLPAFSLLLYFINRGEGVTRALYMHCDRSLLTYSFFKRPGMILKLFRIRLLEIIKVNLLPGSVIAAALPLLLYITGGTENPLDYVVLAASILAMSVFFSVHYLTLYYLLQPYNAQSELKHGGYQTINALTYFACYLLTQLELRGLKFGILCILFCVGYCVAAGVMVYFLAPKTFRIRG